MRFVFQSNHYAYSSPTILGNRWTLPTGMKLRINLLFFFASASGLCFWFIKLFLFWPMGFFSIFFLPSVLLRRGVKRVIGLGTLHLFMVRPLHHTTPVLAHFPFGSPHTLYIQENRVLHWGYCDFFYMRRIKMIQLPSYFSSVNHWNLSVDFLMSPF